MIIMTRPSASALLRTFVVAATVGIVLVAAACGSRPTSGAPPAGAPVPGVGLPEESSTPTEPPSPSPSSALPRGWRLCANAHVGYSIGYPEAWYTTALREEEVCSQFHPTAFTIPQGSEYPLTALITRPVSALPAAPVDPLFARSLLWEKTSVGAHRAVRFEEEFTGDGLYERGTRRYGFVVDLDGRALTVYTIAVPSTASYADWKVVVDQAVRTLELASA